MQLFFWIFCFWIEEVQISIYSTWIHGFYSEIYESLLLIYDETSVLNTLKKLMKIFVIFSSFFNLCTSTRNYWIYVPDVCSRVTWFLCMSLEPWTLISTVIITYMLWSFCLCSIDRGERGGCSFCWYCQNRWPWQFELSFHNVHCSYIKNTNVLAGIYFVKSKSENCIDKIIL
jgi:hypothetical protein